MRTLLVEDDPLIATMVRTMLGREGHVVEVADTGDQGLWMATEFDFDVIVLDWSLPTRDGISVCQELRARGRWVPILMLTGNSAVDQRVTGLRAGADDYLTKPFAAEELSARLQALTRRAPQERPTVLTVGDLTLDPATRAVARGGVAVVLRPKEHALLELFMRRPGEVLDRGEILDKAWDLHFDGMSNVVDSHVKSLRSKIDKPFGRASIETIWRVGYRLNST